MSEEVHGYWLGKKAVQLETNRLAFPKALFDLKIAKYDRHGYWGFDRETNYVVFTRDPDVLREAPGYGFRGEAKVYDNGVATVPLQFFGEEHYDGAATGSTPVEEELQFDFDQPRVFYTTDELAADNICYILTSRQWLEVAPGDHNTELVADGGPRSIFGASTLREKLTKTPFGPISVANRAYPDAYFRKFEVMDVDTGVVYSIPHSMRTEAGDSQQSPDNMDDWREPGRMEAAIEDDEVVKIPSGEVVTATKLWESIHDAESPR